MGQPLTLDEIQVDPARAAQLIYDLRRENERLRLAADPALLNERDDLHAENQLLRALLAEWAGPAREQGTDLLGRTQGALD